MAHCTGISQHHDSMVISHAKLCQEYGGQNCARASISAITALCWQQSAKLIVGVAPVGGELGLGGEAPAAQEVLTGSIHSLLHCPLIKRLLAFPTAPALLAASTLPGAGPKAARLCIIRQQVAHHGRPGLVTVALQ
jgi:hypothetical protein